VPEKELGLIFEPFYPVDAARGHGSAEGKGLGLAIAARTVALHGGGIEALDDIRRYPSPLPTPTMTDRGIRRSPVFGVSHLATVLIDTPSSRATWNLARPPYTHLTLDTIPPALERAGPHDF
jgi:hypothetical protein